MRRWNGPCLEVQFSFAPGAVPDLRRWSHARKWQATGLGTRRRPSAEAQHPKGHGALSRGVLLDRPRSGMPSGGAGDTGQSSTARRPNADLSPGERQLHGPEALGQLGTDRHRPGPTLPLAADREGGESKGTRNLQVERRLSLVARAREGPQVGGPPGPSSR
jgi:hypothetical protein